MAEHYVNIYIYTHIDLHIYIYTYIACAIMFIVYADQHNNIIHMATPGKLIP